MPSLSDFDVPHLDQYFGLWSIYEPPFQAAVDRVRQMDLATHVQQSKPQQVSYSFPVVDGVAVISLSGPLMKHVSSLSGGTSTIVARRQIRMAARDPDIAAIALRIDSPGGTVAGTLDLAEEVAAAASRKPVHAYIEDLGASAAYWVASQASAVYANPTALVGSIGTFQVVYDLSGMAAMEGIKVHVIRAGEFKGAGTPGTEVTHEQLVEWQRLVDEVNSHFLAGVVKGRRLSMEQVQKLSDGRVHVGASAKALGLVDGIQSFDQMFGQLAKYQKRGQKMSKDVGTEIVAAIQMSDVASYEEIVAECVGADPAFICGQLAAKATLSQAQKAWMKEQQTKLEASEKARKEAEEKAVKQTVSKPGVEQPVQTASATVAGGDVLGQWDAALALKMATGLSRAAATVAVVKEQPELHEAYVTAYNEQHKSAKR